MQLVDLECNTDDCFLPEYPEFPYPKGDLLFAADVGLTAEWLVAAQHITRPITTTVPRERRILVVTEPRGYFPDGYVNQFGILISPFAIDTHRGVWVQDHGALPALFNIDYEVWPWAAVFDHRDLAQLVPPPKRDAISVVVSDKSILPGHRHRLELIRRLQARLGDRLEVFGRGFRWVDRKSEAILPYKYHLALENTQMPFYWTEKTADAYLGFAFPFVAGPPNLDRWFARESFEPIDVADPDQAVATIVRMMDAGIYEERLPAIRNAREHLLREERLCHVVARAIAAHPNTAPRLTVAETIKPTPKRNALHRARREIGRLYWQADSWLRHRRGTRQRSRKQP